MTELVNSRTADVAQRDELMSGARASSCRLTVKRPARLEGLEATTAGASVLLPRERRGPANFRI